MGYKNITNFDDLIELEHGKLGTKSRNKYEERAQMFIVSEMLKKDSIRGLSIHCLEILN